MSDSAESTQQDWLISRGGAVSMIGGATLFTGYIWTSALVMKLGLAVCVLGYATVAYDFVLPKILGVMNLA